ncbi:MAG: glycosyltransferase family 87 protein [Flavobacteriales bacterium]
MALVFMLAELRLGRNDFDIFFSAAQDMKAQVDIYSAEYFDGYHYYYSLLFASFLALFPPEGLLIAKGLWMIVNFLILFRIWKISGEFFFEKKPNDCSVDWKIKLFGLVLFLITIRFIRANLHFGQVTIFIFYLCLEGLRAIWNDKWWGGLLIGLGINIKLLPLVFIPYLLYRGKWKSSLIVIGSAILFFYLPLFWLRPYYWEEMFVSYLNLLHPSQDKHLLDVEEGSFHSLTTWISTLFHEAAREHNALELRRHIADLPIEVVKVIILIARVAIVSLTLLYLRGKLFSSKLDRKSLWFEWSWFFATIPLIFPHQQHYAFFMIFPALAFIVFKWWNGELSSPLKWLFSVIVVVFNLSILMGTFNGIYNHYKIITIAALFLLWVLWRVRPKKSYF